MPKAREKRGAPDRETLHRALEEIYAGPAWHGPALKVVLRGVHAEAAKWRPADGRNSVWEIVLHLAYTRHRLLLRLDENLHERFVRPLRVPWWPRALEPQDETSWRADLALLDACHRRLVAEVQRAPDAVLRSVRRGQARTLAHEVLGVALHDAYHAGQIRLLTKLQQATT
jgi:hypothetical protein